MKLIPLSAGRFAKVDDEDFDFLNQWKWTYLKSGYAYRHLRENGKRVGTIYMHQQLLPDVKSVDHRDGDGLNNQKANLRSADSVQQGQNTKQRINCSSRFKGVWRDDNRGSWYTYITINKKRKFLGRYGGEIEAAKVYNENALKYFGEFARLNRIEDAI